MSSAKEAVITAVQNLPDSATFEQILEELVFSAKVNQGLSELDSGQGLSNEQAAEKLSKWLKP